jgi:hypothetical protein
MGKGKQGIKEWTSDRKKVSNRVQREEREAKVSLEKLRKQRV